MAPGKGSRGADAWVHPRSQRSQPALLAALLAAVLGMLVGWVALAGRRSGGAAGRLGQEVGPPPWTLIGAPTHTAFRVGRQECGRWQADYTALHRDIVAGRGRPRYAAVYCTRGMADCLKGAMTIFYFAVLSRRAFQMYLPYDGKYEWAFAQPSINWTFTDPAAAGFGDSTLDVVVTAENKRKIFGTFNAGDVADFGGDTAFLHFDLGWGTARWMGDNPWLRDWMYRQGMRPASMIGCALDYLIQPLPEVRDMFPDEIEAMSDTKALKIGIQVRNSDLIITNRKQDLVNVTDMSSFFACAEEIERSRSYPGQRVIWYFISDSMHLRRDVKRVYGDKVVTSLEMRVRHIARIRSSKENVMPAFMGAAGELWLFSTADFHVLSSYSGFGATAALWSRRWHNQYNIDNKLNTPRQCGVHDYDITDGRNF